ncbi:hypothetical protein [Nocardia brasiliensis]|uniref:hypothetical protein n=1 Tax=Nocardia brasiliensis TaxID=37326 RepID=UPI0011DCE9EE|nr:hypothetical protein [Nocardia brasiliensis]
MSQLKTFDKRGRHDAPDTAEYFKSKIEGSSEMVNTSTLTSESGTYKEYAEKWRDRARAEGTFKARQQFGDIRGWTDLLLTRRPWCERKPIQLSTTSLYLQHLTTLLQIAVYDGLILENAASKFKLDGDELRRGSEGPTATELLTPHLISRIRRMLPRLSPS